MKKRTIAFLLALMLCAGLSSCGKTAAESDAKESAEAVTTVSTTAAATTTTAETTTEKKTEEAETTKAKSKKKKKKKKASDTKKTETKTETKKVEKAAPTSITYENDVYSMSLDENDWVSATDLKKLIAQGASNSFMSADQLESLVGNIYFYKEADSNNYPTVVVITNPVYQSSLANIKIEDAVEPLMASVKQQFETQNNMTLNSYELVNHAGINMLCLNAQGERGGITCDCYEYIFLKNGNMCMIAATYSDAEKGKKEFEAMLDTISFK